MKLRRYTIVPIALLAVIFSNTAYSSSSCAVNGETILYINRVIVGPNDQNDNLNAVAVGVSPYNDLSTEVFFKVKADVGIDDVLGRALLTQLQLALADQLRVELKNYRQSNENCANYGFTSVHVYR